MACRSTVARVVTAALTVVGAATAQTRPGQVGARSPVSGPESADVEFVRKAAEGAMKEVELGKLASEKASNFEVRAFGKQMVADHSKSKAELMALASLPPPSAPAKPEEDLAGLSGSAFDRAYMARMVADHQATVELFETEARDGKDDALRTWAADKLPTIRGHLEKAQLIHGRVTQTAP